MPISQREQAKRLMLLSRRVSAVKLQAAIEAALDACVGAETERCAKVVEKQLEVPLPNETVEIVQFIATALRATKRVK